MRAIYLSAICLGLVLSIGCEEPSTTSSSLGNSGSTSAPPPPVPGATNIIGSTTIDEDLGETDDAYAEAPASHDGAADGYQREVLAVGADKRGRNYGGGVITEPIRQYFRAGQRINLLNLKRAMDLYKAGNNNKLPATHEQFMKEIVEANAIELPELPDGERYVFDPQRGELMVERPQQE